MAIWPEIDPAGSIVDAPAKWLREGNCHSS
jgi:hypothetical protein